MRSFLLASTLLVAVGASPVQSAVLTIDVFSGSTLVGTATGSGGVVNFNSSSVPGFDSISVSADGFPNVTGGDLTSTTLDVSSGSGGVHVLTVDVFQTGITVGHGTARSTFTTNNLIGTPGPTSMATFINGTDSTLGHQIASAAFPAGTTNDTTGPISSSIPDVFADAAQYRVVFTGADQSANDTIQLTTVSTVIPETSTWAMMLVGFVGLAFGALARKRVNQFMV